MGPKELKFSRKVVFLSRDPITLPSASSEPVDAVNGDMYYDTTDNVVKVYQNGVWVRLSSAGSGANINKFTLSPTDITNKFVTLSSVPTTLSNTILDVIGGPTQDYSIDFTVTGTTLSWNALGLDGVLTSGDKLIVQFD